MYNFTVGGLELEKNIGLFLFVFSASPTLVLYRFC